jgi:hypothetical protein
MKRRFKEIALSHFNALPAKYRMIVLLKDIERNPALYQGLGGKPFKAHERQSTLGNPKPRFPGGGRPV